MLGFFFIPEFLRSTESPPMVFPALQRESESNATVGDSTTSRSIPG
jgi:hypothetical protein